MFATRTKLEIEIKSWKHFRVNWQTDDWIYATVADTPF